MNVDQIHPDELQERSSGINDDMRGPLRLAAAMLYCAVVDAASHSLHRKRDGSYTLTTGFEAWQYVHREDVDWPFSFVNLCMLFGVDAGRIRRRIAQKPLEILRARPGARPANQNHWSAQTDLYSPARAA